MSCVLSSSATGAEQRGSGGEEEGCRMGKRNGYLKNEEDYG